MTAYYIQNRIIENSFDLFSFTKWSVRIATHWTAHTQFYVKYYCDFMCHKFLLMFFHWEHAFVVKYGICWLYSQKNEIKILWVVGHSQVGGK